MANITRPNNFGEVVPGIYRSAFPHVGLHKTHLKGIKTIIKLVKTPYNEAENEFIQVNGINVYLLALKPNKDSNETNECSEDINMVMKILLDRKNHPILIHCNHGKHRTGCVVGCFRRLQGWKLENILEEYRMYAGTKFRLLDEEFIERYEPGQIRQINSAFRPF
ncbi:uncharacterized protein N7479_003419 [Penicillium vulpinum]|uniref:uncharacterized protein n=1 Tax=Penicillium vulpinum TaxID=29845 RepID=UPI002547B436|nr:uncharacterized protein N7479_003419 [Penicillium vulpinum]KAJ5963543.1 hypothetical protein N7479_003419 [Penicillium vulpinum]